MAESNHIAQLAAIKLLRKRSGHMIAKTRLLSAQMDTFLTNDLWLRNARHANAMAAKLSKALARHSAIEFVHPTFREFAVASRDFRQ